MLGHEATAPERGLRVRFALGSRHRGLSVPLSSCEQAPKQAQHDRKQFILRRDAEPLIGALAAGQDRMQADAERLRDRLGAETEKDTSICFSEIEMSSRLASSVEPSCGTKAIGASLRSFASIG